MKNIIIAILCIVIVILGSALIDEKRGDKERRENLPARHEDENVYIDKESCIHTDKNCFHLYENYAVRVVKKTDPYLDNRYLYVCVECYDPESIEEARKRSEKK